MPNRLDLDQTHKNLVRLLERKLRPIHYREAFNESKVWSTESYSDRTNPVEKFRQRYAEHDHDDVFFIAGGYMALARWFPIRTQMHLLAPQETVTIEGNCIVSFDAGYYRLRLAHLDYWLGEICQPDIANKLRDIAKRSEA